MRPKTPINKQTNIVSAVGMLVSLLRYEEDGSLDQSSMIPLVDGGTEGFKGNARVILPGMSACIECMLDLYPPQVQYSICTGLPISTRLDLYPPLPATPQYTTAVQRERRRYLFTFIAVFPEQTIMLFFLSVCLSTAAILFRYSYVTCRQCLIFSVHISFIRTSIRSRIHSFFSFAQVKKILSMFTSTPRIPLTPRPPA